MIKLKQYRKAAKMTQSDLGEAVGVARTQITKWELGTQEPSLAWIKRLCKALNIPREALLSDAPFTPPPEDIDEVVWEITSYLIDQARLHPKLDRRLLLNIGKATFKAYKSGKVAVTKKKVENTKTISKEMTKLIEYELDRSFQ